MYQIDFERPGHIYFAGIGGISMSGLAEILESRGFAVAGSDRASSAVTEELSSHGIRVYIGQKRENLEEEISLFGPIDAVVFTAAIGRDNPEYIYVQEKGIPSLTRAQLLGQIMRRYGTPVGIAGTHGKTTTTSMISEILLKADLDPTLSIGGILKAIGSRQVRVGGPDYFVAEACEYTDSFLDIYSKISLILNVEYDHPDYFPDLNAYRASFRRYAENVPEDGTLVISTDIPDYTFFTEGLSCRVITFGSGKDADYRARNISFDGDGYPCYDLVSPAGESHVLLHVPGIHNISNSLAALAAADLMGVPRSASLKALSEFEGTDRRFEYICNWKGIPVYDDYAHHPTEIHAALTSARKFPCERLFVVFQSHTFTRTMELMDDFVKELSLADKLVIAPIYPAREAPIPGVTCHAMAERLRALGCDCISFDTFAEIEDYLLKNCRKGDLLITMGAGDVNKIAAFLKDQAKE